MNPITRDWQELPPLPCRGRIIESKKVNNCVAVSVVEKDNFHWVSTDGVKLLSYDLLHGDSTWRITVLTLQNIHLKETWSIFDFEIDFLDNGVHYSINNLLRDVPL